MMSTREFIQHLLLNCELDDPVHIEACVPDGDHNRYLRLIPAHAYRIGEDNDEPETLIECKPYREEY